MLPFLLINKNAENVGLNGGNTAFAVKGPLYPGMKLRRKISGELSIVVFDSPLMKENWQKNAGIILPLSNKWKLSQALLQQTAIVQQETENIELLVQVTVLSSFLEKCRRTTGLTIISSDEITGTVQLKTRRAWINTAIDDPSILFIAQARKAFTERELTGFDLSTNKINLAHWIFPAVNGNGLVVSIKENKFDTTDMDLHGRYVYSPAASPDMQTHATTMATIIAGAGNTFYTGRGAAWGASVSSSNFANLLPDNIAELNRLKVSVQNHSYGVGIENYYGADAAAYDAQSFQQLSLMHVFSAGNIGTQASSSGNYAGIPGYANISGSFKMAKNNLVVGSTDSFGVVPALSSRGPAYDGRLKPELVALGEDGSSGAAAIVSGISLLVQDAWLQRKGSLPSSSLVKAVLVNSATDVEAKGIDFQSGYGNVNAYRAIQTVMQDRVIQGTLQQGQANTHALTIPANAKNLKISLCWTDPPAQPNSFKALQNDVDLELFRPASNERWQPWVLSSAANTDSLKSLPTRRRDSLNTIEQITIDNPAAGNYDILVKAFSLSNSQAYSIAWQYDTLDHLLITYPVKGDNIFPNQAHLIRWETTLTGNALLEYRINTGNWKMASAVVDLSKNYFRWQAPDSLGALQLRLTAGNKTVYTDTVSLSNNLLINTGFNCVDSFLVYWQRAAVDSYRVYRLGPRYLEQFTVTKDTALLQYTQNNAFKFFTVAPLLPFGIEGVRSYTFDYTQQQTGCYISSFIADPVGNSSANLNLQLGTIYNVAGVVFEKLTAAGFTPLQMITPITSRQVLATEPANKGVNTYRARIQLKTGVSYYTQAEQVYIFASQPYYVFPNPLRQGMPLQLLAEDPDDVVFSVFDLNGRKLAEQRPQGFLTPIKLPLLPRGIYYYRIIKAGVKQESHPFVIY